jgi:hypothetical protein
MNGEPRNKHVRTELDICQKLVGQQCRIYFDTRRERVNMLKQVEHMVPLCFKRLNKEAAPRDL